ncbi:tape measure protein [Hymenobacter lapidarius]|uniref:tape measure protein n=1 Tax=Hymenobacter lapidarius TaxID=1908237 RepID=UPI0013013AD3|nr:tape measure protein [Hymenobacter lapidarius]
MRDARRLQTNATKEAAAAAKDLNVQVKAEAAARKEAATARQQPANDSAGSSGGFFGSLLGKVGPLAAGLVTVNAVVDKIKQGISNFAALSGLQATLVGVAGSVREGGREFAYVKAQADALGVPLLTLGKAYTGIFTAGKEANFTAAETRDIFEAVAGEAKVLQKSDAELEQALRAVQQIMSKGKLTAEELRGQLGDVLPDATAKAAKALGVTTAELDKMLQKGTITARDFLPKFAAEIKRTYGDATANAATQLGSNISRINTFLQESSAKLGAFFAPAIKYVAEFVSSAKLASDATAQEQVELEESLVAITSLNVGNAERTRLIKELQAEYPALLGNINAEKVGNDELSTAIDKVSASLVNRIVLEKQQEKIADQAAKTADALRKRLEAEIEIRKQLGRLYVERQRNVESSNGIRAINDNGSIGFGADIRKENQGLPLAVAAQNTLDQIAGRKVAISTVSPAVRELFQATEAYRKAQIALNTEEDKSNELTRQKAAFMQALGISTAASTGALTGNTAALTKSIDALQAHRAEVQKQLESLTTNDYDDTGYRKRLAGYQADLEKTDKLIAELQGKQDKSADKRENKQAQLLEAYLREQQTYKELALKAAEQQEDDAKKASERQFQLDLTNIYESSRKLKASKKAAGQGNAFDAVQLEQENTLIQGAYDAHYERLLAIQRTKQDQLLDLQKEGDQKQLDALALAFEKEKDKYASQPAQLKAAIERYGRERAKLLLDQEQKRLDEEQKLASSVAESAALDFTDPVKAEEVRQQGLFAVKLKYALKEIDLKRRVLDSDPSTANKDALQVAQNTYDGLLAMQKKSEGKFDLYRLILGKADSPELREALDEVTASVVGSISQILQAQQQAAAQKAADATTAIGELQNQLNQELQYREEGSAANVAATRAAIAEQRQIRKEALIEQRQAAKAQVLLDTITQAGNLITAVSNVFAGTSKLDAILPGAGIAAGIALSAVLVGAFTASKITAFQAAGQIGGGSFYTGGFTEKGGKYEEAGVVHKGEFVANQELTKDYYSLFKALHEGKPGEIDWSAPSMRELLPPPLLPRQPIALPDYALPARLRAQQQEYNQRQQAQAQQPVNAAFAQMNTRLAAIEASNQRMADTPTVAALGPDRVLLTYADGTTKIVNYSG